MSRVTSNLGLAHMVAREYVTKCYLYVDAFQDAVIGLIIAERKWDEERTNARGWVNFACKGMRLQCLDGRRRDTQLVTIEKHMRSRLSLYYRYEGAFIQRCEEMELGQTKRRNLFSARHCDRINHYPQQKEIL